MHVCHQAQLGGLGDLLDQLRGQLNTGTGEGATVDTLHDWRVEYHFDSVSVLIRMASLVLAPVKPVLNCANICFANLVRNFWVEPSWFLIARTVADLVGSIR